MKILLQLSGAKEDLVRRAVAKALGNFKSSVVIERLTDMLIDEDSWTRLAAYLSLVEVTGLNSRIVKIYALRFKDFVDDNFN